ncbi:hypothetical protein [Dickeya undicola]|nr:hypothetical protein [Dickeya undicola]
MRQFYDRFMKNGTPTTVRFRPDSRRIQPLPKTAAPFNFSHYLPATT